MEMKIVYWKNIIIHEKIPIKENNIVIKAARGELKSAEISDQLQLCFVDGNRYEEVTLQKKSEDENEIPHS